MMRKRVLVAQSGGPTVAINASLAGVIAGVVRSGEYERIIGAANGILGVLNERFTDLSIFENDVKAGNDSISDIVISGNDDVQKAWCPKSKLDRLAVTPSMYLGSCRFKLPFYEEDSQLYEKIFAILDKNNIGMFFYIGGNDSMDTVNKLSAYAKRISSDIRFAGIPKSIDNDLPHTDHTPGYGSAAKYIAASIAEMAHDVKIYDIPCVTIIELMGRNAGWLTGAAALARSEYNELPQLIYLPEVDFDKDEFIEDVKNELKKSNCVMVAVSEGIHDSDGNYINAGTSDTFGHDQLGGAAKTLEFLVKEKLHIKCRSVEINIMQRCAAHMAAGTDIREAYELGIAGAKYAIEGNTGFIPVLKRISDAPYRSVIEYADLKSIANVEKKVPLEWINKAHNNVTDNMLEYVKPLIKGEIMLPYKNGLPDYLWQDTKYMD
ncbi:6-phosphofructokinase [Butyribacter intestini]|uniref:6-phosphofructokinase n=1 Tax=Butyribacter intestini TaxID=1703332 RepID=UPI003A7F1D75